jgi:Domain of unknown function (DUF4190)
MGGSPYYRSSYVAPKTSGMAIASFVLSLLWIFGLGAIVALFLARSARREIAHSNGTITGDGFAIAGMVLGVIGVITGAFFVFWIVFAVHQLNNFARNGIGPFSTTTTLPYTTLHPGEPSSALSDFGGGTITVYSVHSVLVGANPAMRTAPFGDEFVSVHVKACAGARAVVDPAIAWTGLTLVTSNEFNYVDPLTPLEFVQQPAFDPPSVSALRPHQCVAGFQGFVVTSGAALSYVGWHSSSFEWRWTVTS